MILKPSKKNIQRVVQALTNGKIVCLPTDTLYALSCDASDNKAVQKIYDIKKRSYFKALPIFVASISQAYKYGVFNQAALKLANTYWPGEITIVVPLKRSNISKYVLADSQSIAIRIPNKDYIIDIIKELDSPIIGTSANISYEPNLHSVDEIARVFGEYIDIILEDNDFISKGVNSTILDCRTKRVKILRNGAVSKENIEKVCKIKIS